MITSDSSCFGRDARALVMNYKYWGDINFSVCSLHFLWEQDQSSGSFFWFYFELECYSQLILNLFDLVKVMSVFSSIFLNPVLCCILLCSWPGPADPDGGVDATAPPADPAAHLRLPVGTAQRGRARVEGWRPSTGCPSGRPQSQHP